MTDQAPGSGYPSRQPDDGADGTRAPGPNPFSRESAGEAPAPERTPYSWEAGSQTPPDGPSPDPQRQPQPQPHQYQQPQPQPQPQAYPHPPTYPDPAFPAQPAPPSGAPHAGAAPSPGRQPDGPGYGYGQPGTGGYDVAAYPGGYGGWSGYGAPPVPHPQATAALVTGILAGTFGLLCGFGGLIGIASIILGLKVRREIDGDPARWTGRGSGTAGLVLGVISVVALVLWVVLFVLLGALGSS